MAIEPKYTYQWPKPAEPEVSKRGVIKGRSGKGKKWSLHDIPSRQVETDLRTLIQDYGVYFPATDFITLKKFRQGYRRDEFSATGKGPDGEKVKYWAMQGIGGDKRIRVWFGDEELTNVSHIETGSPILVESMHALEVFLSRDNSDQDKKYRPIEGLEWD